MTIRRLFLIRHGETAGESSIRYHGRNDVPLSAVGREQMRRAGWVLSAEVIDTWVASTLHRSWEGARIVSQQAAVRIEPALQEVDFGRWEGHTLPEIEAMDPQLSAAWRSATPATGFDYPGGETAADFERRIFSGTDRLIAETGPCTAAVLHKGVMRKVLRSLGIGDIGRDRPELGEILRIGRIGGGWRLL